MIQRDQTRVWPLANSKTVLLGFMNIHKFESANKKKSAAVIKLESF